MLGLQKRLPSGLVQSEKSIVIDAMALSGVFPNDLPYGTVRPIYFRPCRRSILSDSGQGQQHGQRKQRFDYRFLHHAPCGSSQSGKTSCAVAKAVAVDAVQIEQAQQHVRTSLFVVGKDNRSEEHTSELQ